jgi:alkylation response protein AidB-like acyl-CoA dehydrogenase
MKLQLNRDRYEDAIAFRYTPLGAFPPLGFASLAVGMARGALDCFTEQAKARKPFNLPYPHVADMPSAQVTAGKARAMINAATAVVHQHADEADRRGPLGADFTPAEHTELTMDMAYAIQLASDVINMLQLALGSSTLSLKSPVQRFVRDVRVLSTHGALRFDPMAEISGRLVLGFEPLPLYPAIDLLK